MIGTTTAQQVVNKPVGLSSRHRIAARKPLFSTSSHPRSPLRTRAGASSIVRAAVQYEPDDELERKVQAKKAPKEVAKDIQSQVVHSGEEVVEKVEEVAEEVKHWAQDEFHRLMGDAETSSDPAQNISNKAQQAKTQVQDTARDINSRAKGSAQDLKAAAQRNLGQSQNKLKQEANKQPSWVRQFALVTGTVIAVAALTTVIIVPFLRNFGGGGPAM